MWGAGGSGAKMCCCGNGLPVTPVKPPVKEQLQWEQAITYTVV